MKTESTIQIHFKNYRLLMAEREDLQENISNKVLEILYVSMDTLENALWDANPRIYYSIDGEIIRFDTKGLYRVLLNIEDYS